jgi:pyrroline-5-carboxylate reductase
MGEAILRGLGATGPGRVRAFDPNAARRQALADLRDVEWATSPAAAVQGARVILLAVKPQVMPGVLAEIAPSAAGLLVVSIAAGITTASLVAGLPGARVVRTMPNTPLMAGRGTVALCPGRTAGEADLEIAESLFPGSTLLRVREELMDAVTAVSGSGPAYFFAFVEALSAAGVRQGFDAETAYRLAAATFVGAGALLDKSGVDAAELRRRVTSPGGTTAAALKVFADRNLPEIVAEAVEAATRRGKELSEGSRF